MTVERFAFDKIADEKLVLSFDFSNALATGEILTGVPTAVVSVVRGKDATPNDLLNGACQIDASTKVVLLPVKGGIKGTEYNIRVVAATSNLLKVLAIDAVLPVI